MQNPAQDPIPLVVDLDGTLVRSDLLWESFAAAVARKPWLVFAVPFWLLAGRATLKENLARAGPVDVTRLPYHADVLEWLRSEHRNGRQIAIATAAHESLATQVATHLAVVSRVFATRDRVNFKGEAKRAGLVEAYGERGYDYVGNSAADIPAWRSARLAHSAGTPTLARSIRAQGREGREFTRARPTPAPLLRLLRLHQWAKNLLVFVPVVTAHRAGDPGALADAALAFVAFSLAASAVYVMNDLVDLDADRRHPAKRARPFASGDLPLAWAALLLPLLLAASACLAAMLPGEFHIALGAYLLATLAYAFGVKRAVAFDVLTLAGLYTLRIFAGAAAIEVPLSHWLLAFSMFLFLSLAFVKRYSELAELAADASEVRTVAGRGYRTGDLQAVGVLGATSGYLAVLVFTLFITSADTLVQYREPAVLWAAPMLFLYWITRAWLITYRGEIDGDPVAFALTDPPSYVVVVALLAVVWAAT